MDKLLKKLNIDETLTKPFKFKKIYNKVKNNINLEPFCNYQMDLLFIPESKNKYKYLLVVDDLASNQFDIEPLKTKTSDEVLEAFKKMIKRKYIKMPKYTVRTDNGSEFQGVFQKWLKNNNVYHSVSYPYRKQQLANVENLNRTLGRLIIGYLNYIEHKTGKPENDWEKILPTIRIELNKIRKFDYEQYKPTQYKNILKAEKYYLNHQPTFKIGELVHYKLSYPLNISGLKQKTSKFREGDLRFSKYPRKIVDIVYMNDPPYYRYILNELPNVSFAPQELKKNVYNYKNELFIVNKIIDKKNVGNKTYYLVWWMDTPKNKSTWKSKSKLIKDGLTSYIKEYEDK